MKRYKLEGNVLVEDPKGEWIKAKEVDEFTMILSKCLGGIEINRIVEAYKKTVG